MSLYIGGTLSSMKSDRDPYEKRSKGLPWAPDTMQPPRHAQPVCAITGAGSGIGAACARHFARQGWRVLVNAYPAAGAGDAQAVRDDCLAAGGDALVVEGDVRRDEDMQRMAASAVDAWGRIDALVNCAGTTRFVPHADLHGLSPQDFLDVYAVNVVGTFLATRACTDALRRAQGSVVVLSSLAASTGTGSSLAYAASKGALNSMTLSLARSLAPDVRVNAIAPGLVNDGLPSRVLGAERYGQVRERLEAAAPLRRSSSPEEVAALVYMVTAYAPGMTGEIVGLDNGLRLNAG